MTGGGQQTQALGRQACGEVRRMSKSTWETGLRAWTQTQGGVRAAVWGRRPASWRAGRRRDGATLPGHWASPQWLPVRALPCRGLGLPAAVLLPASLSSHGGPSWLTLGLRWAWPLPSHTGSLFPGTEQSLPCAPLRLLWALGHIQSCQVTACLGATRPRSRTLPGPHGLPRAGQESPGEAVA